MLFAFVLSNFNLQQCLKCLVLSRSVTIQSLFFLYGRFCSLCNSNFDLFPLYLARERSTTASCL